MFRYEWKKLLHYRRGGLLIALFLVAELLGLILFTQPYDKVLEENRGVYDSYLTLVEGPLTEDSRAYIEGEMDRLNTVHRQMDRLKTDYYSGAVTEEEFRAGFEDLVDDDSAYTGFARLYRQYIFVRETEIRSFLYTGGWEVLLGNREPDYLFLLLLVFLLTPVFCQEYGSRMDQILLTQKKSARCQWQVKVLTALTLTAVLTAVLQLFRLVYCAVAYGLPHWDYTLQSLNSFGDAEKIMTLRQAFLLQFALKEVGYLYCAVVILFLSVFFKKFNLALMAGLAVLPLPLLTVTEHTGFLRIPGPWALTIGGIYLDPSLEYLDPRTDLPVTVLAEVTWHELGLVLIGAAVIMGLMLGYIRQKNTNYHAKAHGRKRMAALAVAALLLCGCAPAQKEVVYNSANASWFENDQFLVFSYDLDHSLYLDKQTGQYQEFPLSAYTGETASVKGYFYEENGYLYYLKSTDLHPHGGTEAIQTFDVIAGMDTNTLEESVFYQWASDPSWFFGLLELPSTEENAFYIGEFFLHGKYIYYLRNSEFYRMDRFTGAYEQYMVLPNVTNLAYDGQHVYYTDNYNRLVLRNLDSGKERTVEEVVADDFLLTPEGVYFLNRRDSNTLYRWNKETGVIQKLDDTPAFDIHWDENYLWITASADISLYRLNHDGTDRTKVECPGFVICIPGGDKLYAHEFETDTLYEVDKNSLQPMPVSVN